jgi:hypothetical protein
MYVGGDYEAELILHGVLPEGVTPSNLYVMTSKAVRDYFRMGITYNFLPDPPIIAPNTTQYATYPQEFFPGFKGEFNVALELNLSGTDGDILEVSVICSLDESNYITTNAFTITLSPANNGVTYAYIPDNWYFAHNGPIDDGP